jgi:arylsulfatase A-like enzyme
LFGPQARKRLLWILLSLALVQALLVVGAPRDEARAQTGPPNIVVILTDDQRSDSLGWMPKLRSSLLHRGMQLRSAVVSNPICCPSRASILTGRYSHTTTVYTNSNLDPNGGWQRFNASGYESNTIATALDGAGYRTGLFGKYMNGYAAAGEYVPPGWDRWFAVSSRSTHYYGYTMYDNVRGTLSFGHEPKDYQTDVIRHRAVSFVRSTPDDTPLFLYVTPFAPHSPSRPAPRHIGDLADTTVRLGPAVNEADVSDKPAYIQTQGTTPKDQLIDAMITYRESLLAVDDMVGRLVQVLKDEGRLQNTVLLFTSDNGWSSREHRWRGKLVPYEQSIRVPFIVRSDGEIPAGTATTALASNIDIAPTIAEFAGVPFPGADGVSMVPLLTDSASSVRTSVLLEAVPIDRPVPVYCGVRTQSFVFVHYATGEEELYDLASDPAQLRNIVQARPNKANELRTLTQSLCQPVPPGFSW